MPSACHEDLSKRNPALIMSIGSTTFLLPMITCVQRRSLAITGTKNSVDRRSFGGIKAETDRALDPIGSTHEPVYHLDNVASSLPPYDVGILARRPPVNSSTPVAFASK